MQKSKTFVTQHEFGKLITILVGGMFTFMYSMLILPFTFPLFQALVEGRPFYEAHEYFCLVLYALVDVALGAMLMMVSLIIFIVVSFEKGRGRLVGEE